MAHVGFAAMMLPLCAAIMCYYYDAAIMGGSCLVPVNTSQY